MRRIRHWILWTLEVSLYFYNEGAEGSLFSTL